MSWLDTCDGPVPSAGYLGAIAPGATEDDCYDEDGSPVTSDGADFVMLIDPNDSYVGITTAIDSFQVALRGGGAAGSSPSQFLTAAAWAENGELNGYAFTEWRIYFDTPIDINVSSGNFSMPPSATPVIYGAGYVDAELSSLDLVLLDGATGHFYSGSHTWDLDLTDSSGSDSIVIHLEGPYEAQ